ncbi:RF-1 domain-containing protein [Crepidotus variabilis]|uniref:RF-1 domain-containing protein n=1 Tax=Crepidotus variabilis TaxID=179855 RepID=A0A9P6ERR5_9AGAR|nr:RF-1 domain-containing protein [Crepidotus variabilis]
MSISPVLRAASRSAYRDALRAASVTFSGDAPVLQAFRMKVRTDISQQDASSPELFVKQTQFIREVADVLRKNIVQGERLGESSPENPVYRIRMTKNTELGDNDTIKNPAPTESGRGARRRPSNFCADAALAEDSDIESSIPNSSSPNPMNFSALKRAHKVRVVPELLESDLEESFVRGSGPGGQSVNKTENNVQLLHKPTALRVSCQQTRSLSENRKIARKILLEKLDKIQNPGLSKGEMKAAKQRERERRRRKKAKKKAQKAQDEPDSQSD